MFKMNQEELPEYQPPCYFNLITNHVLADYNPEMRKDVAVRFVVGNEVTMLTVMRKVSQTEVQKDIHLAGRTLYEIYQELTK